MRNLYSIILAGFFASFGVSSVQAQYCAISGGYSSSWTGISVVSTTGAQTNFFQSSANSTGYFNYSGSQVASATAGSSFTLRITSRYGHRAYIDFDGNGNFSANEEVASYPSTSSITSTINYTVNIPSNASVGANRIRVVNGYYSASSTSLQPTPCGYYGYRGEVEDYGLNILTPPPNDVGASYAAATICPGTNDFNVRVSNFGTNTLTSATVSGSFGGTNYGPTVITGLNVAQGGDTVITLGQYTATAGNNYSISATATLPNGLTDGNAANNTSSNTLTPALRGTFTFGGSNPDYSNFNSFENDLRNNGVCDTVILNIRTGTYNDQLQLWDVRGADLVNAPIIIQTSPGSSSKAILNASTTGMVRVETGAHDYILRDLQIGSQNNTSSYRVWFGGSSANNIIFDGNDFEGRNINSSSSSYACIYASSSSSWTNIKVHNNNFNYGAYCLYIRGSGSTSRATGWELDGNTFSNYWDYGVYSYYVDWAVFSNNTFNGPREGSFVYSVDVEYSDNTLMENNKFHLTNDPNSQYGYNVYWRYCLNSIVRNNEFYTGSNRSTTYGIMMDYSDDSRVEDNYFELSGTSSLYGIDFRDPDRCSFERNEFNIQTSGGTTYGMYLTNPQGNSSTSVLVANNMIYQDALSTNNIYGIYVNGSADYFDVIHNSVNIQLGGTSSRAGYFTFSGSNSTNSIRNNIFTNEGPGYSIYMNSSNAAARDNNCYYSNGAATGYIQGNFNNLAGLQAISTNDDQNSLIYFPDYVSQSDLHISFDETIDKAGAPASNLVPTDWDGDVRSTTTPDIGLDEYIVPQNSVGLVSIDAPVTPICGLGGLYDIEIRNVGTGVLTSFNVDGEVRHLGGGSTPLTTYSYTGNLSSKSTFSFNAGNYTSGFVNGDTLLLWVSNPNGVNDSLNFDDTLSIALTEGISGTFTVGDTTGGNPSAYDYASLVQVQSLLDSVGAICDTVVFEIADGSYSAAMNLIELIGTAPDRPVIFRSMSGDASLVQIRSGAASTITLDGGDNYFFENLSISNTTNGSSTIRMNNGNDNIKIESCIIDNATVNSTNANGAAIYGDNTAQNNLSITNSEVSGGSYNLFLDGGGNNRNSNILLENNSFEEAYYRGVYITNGENYAINMNEVNSTSSYTAGEAIFIDQTIGSMEMMYNKLYNYGVWPARSIRLDNTSSLSSSYAKIANNEIHCGTGASGNTFYGFYMLNTSFMDINHNTVALEGFSTGSAVAYINGGGANELRNNNFANFGNGRAVEIYSTFALTYSDYNNFFTNGAQVGRFDSQNSTDFATWQSNTGLDGNSVSVDPLFYSMTDLRVCAADLDGTGIPSYVMSDIQEQARNASNPDIGADEFTAPSKYSLPNDTVICKGNNLVLDGTLNDGSFAIWNNFQPSQTITINQAGTYRVFVSNVCGQAIDSIVVTENSPATLPNDTHICATANLMLDPQVPNGAYAWSTGASTPMISVSSRGIYAVEVTDANGCVTTDSIAVTESNAVQLPADTSFCKGNTFTINANVGQGSYFWSPSGQTGPVIFAQTSGNYVVNYVDLFGCQSTDNIMIDVVDEPQAQYTYTSTYRTRQFTDLSTDARSYLWVFGDGDSSTVANPVHVYPNGVARYRTVLYVSNDCGSDVYEDIIQIGALPGFEEQLESGQFNVYPNPNNGAFSISLNANDSDYMLEVLSMEGKVIYSENIEGANAGLNQFEVNIEGAASGVYFVRLSSENSSNIQKINIQ